MDALAERIAAFINGSKSPGDFETLALALFERQYARLDPYRRLCESVNVTPDTCSGWKAIPLAPAAAFKRFDMSCAPLDQVAVLFRSSGTTADETSRHYLDADGLALYQHSVKAGFASAVPEAAGLPLWALMPSPVRAPTSSLSAMLGILGADRFYWESEPTPNPSLKGRESSLAAESQPQRGELTSAQGIALGRESLWDDLRDVREPIALFGTAFAFVQLFDAQGDCVLLPAGSVVVETGGFKGRTREVERATLYGMFTERLGVDPSLCFSEYGMSEMTSQFYSRGISGVKRGPPWARTRIIDPLTGTDATLGSRGLLAHYDLANFNSLMAIKTEDTGYALSESPGEDGFVLVGRAENAELRGCSLTVEEIWERERSIVVAGGATGSG